MNIGVVARRYALALYEYAKEERAEVAVYKNMLQLKNALRQMKEFPVVLRNPAMDVGEKVRLICSAVEEPSPAFERFASLVVNTAREDLLLYMAYSYIDIYREDKKVVAMKITTAAPLSRELQDKIEGIIEQQNDVDIEIRNIVDPSLIGGFICEARGIRLDASVSKQLAEIKKQLVRTNKKLV
ncbi:MAG: F0F1 ATP synthase subunit delta [Bacteroidaceae bacterium]|nr:F0F1 ATP synthase subunit delta [Bacteroidaceae bacterium]